MAAIQNGEEIKQKRDIDAGESETTSPTLTKPRRQSTGFSQRAGQKLSRDEGARQGIKHLGPSNPANKPSQTKYTNIKIKPGKVVDGNDGDAAAKGDENTPLLGGTGGSY
jgi:hypothetical protein